MFRYAILLACKACGPHVHNRARLYNQARLHNEAMKATDRNAHSSQITHAHTYSMTTLTSILSSVLMLVQTLTHFLTLYQKRNFSRQTFHRRSIILSFILSLYGTLVLLVTRTRDWSVRRSRARALSQFSSTRSTTKEKMRSILGEDHEHSLSHSIRLE